MFWCDPPRVSSWLLVDHFDCIRQTPEDVICPTSTSFCDLKLIIRLLHGSVEATKFVFHSKLCRCVKRRWLKRVHQVGLVYATGGSNRLHAAWLDRQTDRQEGVSLESRCVSVNAKSVMTQCLGFPKLWRTNMRLFHAWHNSCPASLRYPSTSCMTSPPLWFFSLI